MHRASPPKPEEAYAGPPILLTPRNHSDSRGAIGLLCGLSPLLIVDRGVGPGAVVALVLAVAIPVDLFPLGNPGLPELFGHGDPAGVPVHVGGVPALQHMCSRPAGTVNLLNVALRQAVDGAFVAFTV